MTRIMGLDVSTKRTGVALPTGRTLSLCPGTTDVARRLQWFEGAVARLVRFYEPELAVLEGYAPRSIGILSTIRLAELGGVVRCTLGRLSVPYIEISPGTLKRYATGNGNATDEAMIAAARAGGGEPDNDDEADAWLLWALGRHGTDRAVLDADLALASIRLEVLSAISWPVAA